MNISYNIFAEYLKSINISELTVQSVVSLFSETRYRAGTTFEHIGNSGDRIGFVTIGLFYMSAPQKNGSLFIKNFIGPKGFLLATFEPLAESTVDITAVCDSVILESKYSEVLRLLSSHPEAMALCKKDWNQSTKIYVIGFPKVRPFLQPHDTLTLRRNLHHLKTKYPSTLLPHILELHPHICAALKRNSEMTLKAMFNDHSLDTATIAVTFKCLAF